MPTTSLDVTFDGTNPAPKLPEQSEVEFFDRWMGYYSVYEGAAGTDLKANVTFSGADWQVATMRFGSSEPNTTIIRDEDSSSGRQIDMLTLGFNSDVELSSTRVRHITGWDGVSHSVKLGDFQDRSTYAISLFAESNTVETGNAYVHSVWTDSSTTSGKDAIKIGSGGAGSVTTGNGNDAITIDSGGAGSVSTDNGNDVVTVNAGGHISSLRAGSGNDRIVVNKDGRITNIDTFEGNKTLIVRDGGRVDQFRGGQGDRVSVTLEGDARMETITAYNTELTVVTGTRFVDTIKGGNVNSDIVIGTGGVGSIRFGSDVENDHKVVANGFVLAIDFDDSNGNPDNDQASNIKLNSFAGNIRLGERKDIVTTGDADAWVESIATNGGNDIVNLGASGAGAVNLGLGNDRISLKKLVDDSPDGFLDIVQIKGGAGSDTILFTKFAGAVTFSLENSAGAQEVSGNSRAFQVNGFENLIGSKRNDDLTGNNKANVINGGIRNDRLAGLEGNDLLIGGQGRDVFVFAADAGNDRIKGFRKGQDSIEIADHVGGFSGLDIARNGKNLEIDHDGGTIVLLGRGGISLSADDFDFV